MKAIIIYVHTYLRTVSYIVATYINNYTMWLKTHFTKLALLTNFMHTYIALNELGNEKFPVKLSSNLDTMDLSFLLCSSGM